VIHVGWTVPLDVAICGRSELLMLLSNVSRQLVIDGC
jgi:hypothetical protein